MLKILNKRPLCSLLIIVCSIMRGQMNLVPNGNFEQFSSCPMGASDIDTSIYWFSPSNLGTPDYYNSCAAESSYVGVPVNWAYYGYQYAHSGEGYSGIYSCQWANNQKEYIEVRLLSSLVANRTYYFSMYVNLLNICKYTTHNIGVYFSDTAIVNRNTFFQPFTPQLTNASTNKFDSLLWTLVSGKYTAHGGESYLMIGNFDPDSSTDTTFYQNTSIPQYMGLYYYIDDVILEDSSMEVETVGLSKLNIYPNPSTGHITVEGKEMTETPQIVEVYNSKGISVFRKNIFGLKNIDLSELNNGIYFLTIKTDNSVSSKRIVISKY